MYLWIEWNAKEQLYNVLSFLDYENGTPRSKCINMNENLNEWKLKTVKYSR